MIPGIAGHPNKVLFLTADAPGVLPPVSKLSESQAMYHFLSGYTSKLAGTETGITEPQAVFSSCFGSPFLPMPASVYTEMLGDKLRKHKATCYLINTGWSGGAFGTGQRIKLDHTRAIVDSVLEGALDSVACDTDPVFGFQIPREVPNVPSEILQPRNTWKDRAAYDQAAKELAAWFRKNFENFAGASEEIKAAAPVE
jgi:phosphoenolpyruvate carboxykinase (ATP)